MRARMAEILRVDHAGEFGAVKIYEAQARVFEGVRGKQAIVNDMVGMKARCTRRASTPC